MSFFNNRIWASGHRPGWNIQESRYLQDVYDAQSVGRYIRPQIIRSERQITLKLIYGYPFNCKDFLKDNANLAKPYEYQILSNWLGKGLLLNDDSDLWKNRRKLLTPAFHFKILEEFVPTINENADILVNKLRNHVGRGTFDIMPYLFSCTLDVICGESVYQNRIVSKLMV